MVEFTVAMEMLSVSIKMEIMNAPVLKVSPVMASIVLVSTYSDCMTEFFEGRRRIDTCPLSLVQKTFQEKFSIETTVLILLFCLEYPVNLYRTRMRWKVYISMPHQFP